MSDTPRNKVNIVGICQANLESAKAQIKAVKNQIKEAEVLIHSITTQQDSELREANAELTRNATFIQDVEREGLPSAKLHEKAAAISARINELKSQHANSKQLAEAKTALEIGQSELKSLEEKSAIFKSQVETANILKSSFEFSKGSTGAIEAMEFETLEDAIKEYLANIPFVVGFSKELNIDRVGLWQVPRASSPHVARIFASKGKVYRINRIPESLTWLKDFNDTPYSGMPMGDASSLEANGITFKMVAEELPPNVEEGADKSGSISAAWMGKMEYEYDAPPLSIFAPDGPRNYARSGLCFIKSESRFYSLWNSKFAGTKMVPGKVEYQQYGNTYTRDGEIPEPCEIDASCLLESFWVPVSKRLNAELVDLDKLQTAKSPLALRIAEAVKSVGVIESTFESRNKRLTSAEITKEVGAYWDAFVNSPWEGHIRGNVAMLKHLCERKLETPHVWSYSIKGFYGLRVRTRDHDWITAYMYCPPSNLSPKDSISHDEVSYFVSGWHNSECNHVRIGPCFLKVTGREK